MPTDYFETPPGLAEYAVLWAKKILANDSYQPARTLFMEPGCGIKAPFADVAYDYFDQVLAVDLMPQPEGFKADELQQYFGCDFLEFSNAHCPNPYDAVVGNPPFTLAEEFIKKGLEILRPGGIQIYLLRLCFLASIKRIPLFKEYPPKHIRVIQRRPSFTYNGKTDGQDYGFFLWVKGQPTVTTIDWFDNSNEYYRLPYLKEEPELK